MKRYALHFLLLGLTVVGCATSEIGRKITPEETTWIKKGVTTRTEVVEKFGAPKYEMPDWSRMGFSSTSTTTTTTTKEDDTQTQKSVSTTTIQTKPKNQFTKALYFHTKSTGGLFVGFKITQDQFWVIYDAQGIVQDHGFFAGMNMTVQ